MNKINLIKQPIKIYLIIVILFFISCKRKIIEKEIFINNSKVISQKYFQGTKYSINNGLNLMKYISEVRDSLIVDSCDLNFDGVFDVKFGYELKKVNRNDSLILEAFIEKNNSDFEFHFEKSGNINVLTPYYDTNNFIGPSSILWKHQNNIKKYRICSNLLEECVIDNTPQLCLKSSSGYYIPPYQSFEGYYYQGFRFRNKANSGNWNYGYFVISYSASSFEIKEIAYESQIDRPIGLRSVY